MVTAVCTLCDTASTLEANFRKCSAWNNERKSTKIKKKLFKIDWLYVE